MILVTGGSGLVGSHVLYELCKSSTPIRATYRYHAHIEKARKLFAYYGEKSLAQSFDQITWVPADIRDIVSLDDAMKGVSMVYHCAALVSFQRADFQRLIAINRYGTANVVNTALDHGVKQIAYISSTAAIGGQPNTLTTEDTKWKQTPHTSGYAISKYLAEKEVWRGVEEGLDAVIINPSVVLGAGNWDDSSLTIFRTVKSGLRFYSPGQNATVDARDIASRLIQLMEMKAVNERFLCIGSNTPFKTLLTTMAEVLQVKPPTLCPPRWLANFAWRLNALISFFTGKKATITKETTNSAYSTMTYSNEKLSKRIPLPMISLRESIENAHAYHTWEKSH